MTSPRRAARAGVRSPEPARVGAGRRLPALPALAVVTVTAAALAGTAPAPVLGPAPTAQASAAALAPPGRPLCRLTDARVVEASGLAAAGGLLWTHDDSGRGVPGVIGLDPACRTVAVIALPGHDVIDPEDLAASTGPAGRTVLWLADTGDNRVRRERVALLRLSVPPVPPGGGSGPGAPVLRADAVAFPLVYADGARDAEALLVDAAGTPALVSKPLLGRPGVYLPSSPLVPDEVTVLRRVGDVRLGRSAVEPARRAAGPAGPLSASLVTGGTVSADGGGVALSTYTDAHVWWAGPAERTAAGGLDLAALLGRPPDVVLPLPDLEQAEAVAWTEDGRALLVTGEGRSAPVHLLPLARPAAQAGRVPATPPPARGSPVVPPGQAPAPAPAAGAPRSGAEGAGAGPAPAAPTARPAEQPAVPLWPGAALLAVLAWSVWAAWRRWRSVRLARRPRG